MIEYLIGVLIVLTVLCRRSDWIEYHVKMIVFAVGTTITSSLLPLPWFIFRLGDYRNALGPAWACRMILRSLGVTYEIRGVENIDKSKGGLVLMNHQSFIDLAVLANLWPIIGRATVVAKRLVLFFFPPSYGWGTLFIDRANRSDSMNKLNKEAEAIRSRSVKLLVFPEGTRGGETDQLLPFKKGPFHIAIQSQSAVQPVVVSRYTFLDGHAKRFKPGRVIISILPEVDCSQMDKSNIAELIERIQSQMQTEYDTINKELVQRIVK